MIVRRMTQEDREDGVKIWRAVFGDSEAFTEWYFRERFCPAFSYAAFDGTRMAAMTLGRPTVIRAENRLHDALLISGVSTVPEYRQKGLMHTLVSMQTETAKAQGFSCCCLHPVSETLYTSLGFRNGTHTRLITSCAKRRHLPFSIREGIDLFAMRTVYDALLSTHDGMQIRDDAELCALLRDYGADGYRMFTAYAEDRPQGYLIVLGGGAVAELLALCSSAYEALIDTAACLLETELKTVVPADCGTDGELVYGMQYLVFENAFELPLKNGFCQLTY